MMDGQEIFEKLLAMRRRIEADGEPLLSSDNALLWDVARSLGLTEPQAAVIAGDMPNLESAEAWEQSRAAELAAEEQQAPDLTEQQTRPITEHDFDRGFGIGGLGRHVEEPIIPSIAAIERVERMEATDVICRKCGASQNFDGAMFTTMAGGNICDDCF